MTATMMSEEEIQSLVDTVTKYVEAAYANGIRQHTDEWLEIRKYTIGGSSLSTIQGKNPYESINSLIRKRIGYTDFESSIQPQWGNLFEDVIKRVVEYQKNTTVHGEDLFVPGGERLPDTSYSPDGIAVIVDDGVPQIVLLEFKCPYSRIPDGKIPKYYIPQIKMGLDLLELPTRGLFVEAVFRRCAWEDLGYNAAYDRTLVDKSSGNLPIAFGIIGFYVTAEHQAHPAVLAALNYFGELGDESNGFMVNDLGSTPPALFTQLMEALDTGKIRAYHGKILFTGGSNPIDVQDQVSYMHAELDAYMDFCSTGVAINIGMVPWKLFRIDYNYVEMEANYVKPWLPQISKLCTFLRQINDPVNINRQFGMYERFLEAYT